jgi:hypothetical protein
MLSIGLAALICVSGGAGRHRFYVFPDLALQARPDNEKILLYGGSSGFN